MQLGGQVQVKFSTPEIFAGNKQEVITWYHLLPQLIDNPWGFLDTL